MSVKKVPIVAIVGRTNVGKSSMFNAFLERREAIVANEPGTTRDSIAAKASWFDRDFWLVDTAGMKDPEDDFELTIQDQIKQAADDADLILVVIEAATVITEDDRRVAKMALKSKKPVVLVVNKMDQVRSPDLDDYRKLGIKDIFLTSMTQHAGLDELRDYIASLLPKASIKESDDRIRMALLGRPNVGKSQLFNALAKKQQAIVADRAGTTRDINRTVVRYMNREIELLDTAGIRRSGKIAPGVERFSVMRTLGAIEQADICLLLIDARDLSVQLDQKIAGLIKDAGKGLILVISKWDTLDKDAYTHDTITPRIQHEFAFVPWAPLIVTSSITGQNVTKLFDLALEIAETRLEKLKTTALNSWLHKLTDHLPPAGLKNRQPKLRYMVQEDNDDLPSFKIFGSQLKYLHWSYRRHLERSFRETFGFNGTAIKFWFIDRDSVKDSEKHLK